MVGTGSRMDWVNVAHIRDKWSALNCVCVCVCVDVCGVCFDGFEGSV